MPTYVCHAAREHRALPHLVNIVIYCMTGVNPHRKNVCRQLETIHVYNL